MKYKCALHGSPNKPLVCINFPSKVAEISGYSSCSFTFTKRGVRKGKCNGCGECCMTCWIVPPGYDRKYKDERCPYLEEGEGKIVGN